MYLILYKQLVKMIQQQSLVKQKFASMGMGLLTKVPIQQNQIILKIPIEQFITYDKLVDFEDLMWITDKSDCKITQFSFYLAFIEMLQNSGNIERLGAMFEQEITYIESIPKTYNNLILWQDNELDELQNKELKKKIINKKQNIFYQFQKISNHIKEQLLQEKNHKRLVVIFQRSQDIDKIRFQNVLKFYSVIQSRNVFFGSCSDSGSEMGALVPMLDLINHSQNSNCEAVLESDFYIVKAVRKIEKNEQIFVNYGNFSCERYLQCYGFLPNIKKRRNKRKMKKQGEGQQRKFLIKQYVENRNKMEK